MGRSRTNSVCLMHRFDLVLYLDQCFDGADAIWVEEDSLQLQQGPGHLDRAGQCPGLSCFSGAEWIPSSWGGRSVVSESEEEEKMGENRWDKSLDQSRVPRAS